MSPCGNALNGGLRLCSALCNSYCLCVRKDELEACKDPHAGPCDIPRSNGRSTVRHLNKCSPQVVSILTMSFDSSDDLLATLSLYEKEEDMAVTESEQQLHELNKASSLIREARSSLATLPSKLRVPILVPLGKHAFFPGHLVHTNELKVHIGANYYVDATAAGASGILQRRHQVVQEDIKKANEHARALKSRLDLPSMSLQEIITEEGLGLMEIRESVEESDALLASAATAKLPLSRSTKITSNSSSSPSRAFTEEEHAKLQQRFAELALLEAEAEAAGQNDDPELTSHLFGGAAAAAAAVPFSAHQQQAALPVVLEEPFESDSDDDGASQPGQAPAAAAPVSREMLQAASSSSSSGRDAIGTSRAGSSSGTGPPGTGTRTTKQGGTPSPTATTHTRAGAVAPAAATAAVQSGAAGAAAGVKSSKPLKPALKKGFLLGSRGSSAGPLPAAAAATKGSRGSPSAAASGAPNQASSQTQQEQPAAQAFTGEVVERVVEGPASSSSSSNQPATVSTDTLLSSGATSRMHRGGPSSVVERVPLEDTQVPAAAIKKPVSKFLQQRRGLI